MEKEYNLLAFKYRHVKVMSSFNLASTFPLPFILFFQKSICKQSHQIHWVLESKHNSDKTSQQGCQAHEFNNSHTFHCHWNISASFHSHFSDLTSFISEGMQLYIPAFIYCLCILHLTYLGSYLQSRTEMVKDIRTEQQNGGEAKEENTPSLSLKQSLQILCFSSHSHAVQHQQQALRLKG